MKGLPRHELEGSIQEIFRGADGDGSGALDRSEFIRCLKESGLGFTRRELNLVLSELDGRNAVVVGAKTQGAENSPVGPRSIIVACARLCLQRAGPGVVRRPRKFWKPAYCCVSCTLLVWLLACTVLPLAEKWLETPFAWLAPGVYM